MPDTDPLAALDHGGVEPPTDFELRRFAQEHAHGVAPGKSVLLSGCWMCRLLVRAAGVTLAATPAPLDGQEAQVLMMAEGVMSRDREIATLRAALALADSMLRSGERHTPQSEAMIRAALTAKENR